MEFDYIVKKEELVNFHVRYIDKTSNYKKSMWIMLSIWWTGSFVISKLFSNIYYTTLIIIIVSICTIFRKSIYIKLLRKKLTDLYSVEKYRNIFEPTHIKIDGIGIRCSTELSQILYKWEGIEDIYLIGDYLFIKTLLNEDLLIPLSFTGDITKAKLTLENMLSNLNRKLIYKYPSSIRYF